MIETFSASTFEIGDIFKICLEDGQAFELTLIDIKIWKYQINDKSEAFSLILTHPNFAWFPQRIYKLENNKTGVLELCIVPILARGGDTKKFYYEVAFS